MGETSSKKLSESARNRVNRRNIFVLLLKLYWITECSSARDYVGTKGSSLGGDFRAKRDVGEMKKLYIGGLFPLSGEFYTSDAEIELKAAQLALNHINSQNILQGYHLDMYFNDTECNAGVGAEVLFDQLYRKPQMIMLLGSGCSEVSKHVAEIVPYWNLVMVSFASTSVALTDREYYPTFFRTVAPDSSHNPARKMFLQRFGWSTVATISQDEEIYSLAVAETIDFLENMNVTFTSTESFVDPNGAVKNLKTIDARIILGFFHEDQARKIFCEAFQLGLYGPKYVWILSGKYREEWWIGKNDTSCTSVQLGKALEGYFSVSRLNLAVNDEPSISGLTSEQFLKLFKEELSASSFAPETYDAVWTIALALNISKDIFEQLANETQETPASLENFNYTREDMKNEFISGIENLKFNGVSGPISFSDHDRVGNTVFEQNQGGKMFRVGVYYTESNQLEFNASGSVNISWPGSRIPRDKSLEKKIQNHINSLAVSMVVLFSSFGIIIGAIFLIFNLKYRKTRYIKLSSPNLNNTVIIGCVLVFISTIMLGLDTATVNEANLPAVCVIRGLTLSCGFSLAFGSLFVKTYRVYQIFRYSKIGVIKNKMLRESRLFFAVITLVVIDVIIFTIWAIIDPYYVNIISLAAEVSEKDDEILLPTVSQCMSERIEIWTGILYAYKGLLLLFGVFLAWETRKVKIEALNDSQYIGMCVYNVVLMTIIAVVLSKIVGWEKQITVSFILLSVFTLLPTTITLCLLFIPKIYAILTSNHLNKQITASDRLQVKGRVRRFVTDDKETVKEILYRGEIQNTAFKKELSKMELSIKKLEESIKILEASEREQNGNIGLHSSVILENLLENIEETYLRNSSETLTAASEEEISAAIKGKTGVVTADSGGDNAAGDILKSREASSDDDEYTVTLKCDSDLDYYELRQYGGDSLLRQSLRSNHESDVISERENIELCNIENSNSKNVKLFSKPESGSGISLPLKNLFSTAIPNNLSEETLRNNTTGSQGAQTMNAKLKKEANQGPALQLNDSTIYYC